MTMASDDTLDRARPQTPTEARELRDRLRARVASAAVAPPRMPMLWCVYYTREHTALALRALDGEYQFAERDDARAPRPGDIAFAAWGGPNSRVPRYSWPGDQTIAMVAFGRVAIAEEHRLLVRQPVVWSDVQDQYLSPAVTDRLHFSAMSVMARKPALCAAVGEPDVPPLAA
jgi:hypothetical protein